MKTTINSRNHGEIEFFCPGNGKYVWVNLNGKTGTLGNQICDGGHLRGNTISYYGEEPGFDAFCRSRKIIT